MLQNLKKLLIFDLDGTLFDTRKLNYNAYKAAFHKFGYQLTFDEYVDLCDGRSYKQFVPKLIKGCSEALMEQIHEAKKEAYGEFLYTATKNEDLFNLIVSRPADTYIAIATTASRCNCMEILTAFHYVDYFDAIITQDDVTRPKPDTECFEILLNRFGVDKENATLYDDTPSVIESAREFGLKVHAVRCFR